MIASVRMHQPQAIDEWVALHTSILQKIVAEQGTGTMASTRQFVAKNTLQEWEKVRAGEQEYVNINWHYLKDYRANVRKLRGNPGSNDSDTEGKAWWQFWK
jgi:hypothetical protein